MSKVEPITKSKAGESRFSDSYDRLIAVESIILLIANFTNQRETDLTDKGLDLPQKEHVELAYEQSNLPMRGRFDRSCDELASVAHAGAQALLRLKSEGRHNLDAAAGKLISEINQIKRQSLATLSF
jgi:hypothetical protein